MKKRGFIKNKVVECIVGMNVGKATLIPIMHVSQPSFETNGYWIIRSQHLVNVAYKVKTHLQNIQVPHVSGNYKGIFVSTKLLLFSWSQCYPI